MLWVVYLVLSGAVFGFLCSYVAGEKNRDRGSWFVAGIFLGFLALLALVAIPTLSDEEKRSRVEPQEKDEELDAWRKAMKRPPR